MKSKFNSYTFYVDSTQQTINFDSLDEVNEYVCDMTGVSQNQVVIVDDVITSGKTVKEVIHAVKDHGGEPIAVTVLIDKSGLSEIEEVPIESLIKVVRL